MADVTIRTGAIRIGISGWTYPPWRGAFYPKGLAQRCELAHASATFRSIEINGTFYGMQTPTAFTQWADATPDDFVFAVKGPRFVTHMLRLRNVATPIANFIASGLLRLGTKLGPILWQLPPTLGFDPVHIEDFLAQLPHDTTAAAALGRRHDHRLKAPAWLRVKSTRPMRHALEVRHDSFRDPAFIALLRRHNVALVCADTVEWPRLMDLTSDFVYCRLHGSEELYRSGYDDAALDRWAQRVRAWSQGKPMRDGDFAGRTAGRAACRDVFMYFDNTDKRRAPDDAQTLMRKLAPATPLHSASGRSPR
jgi:uncharacterized protein YecE (DUF72 family)